MELPPSVSGGPERGWEEAAADGSPPPQLLPAFPAARPWRRDSSRGSSAAASCASWRR